MLGFDVGDVCRVRRWDDMVAMYGMTPDGSIGLDGGCNFVPHMRRLCGQQYTISEVNSVFGGLAGVYRSYEGVERKGTSDDSFWYITEEMLELIDARRQVDPISTDDLISFLDL